jgi:hypothetical protein
MASEDVDRRQVPRERPPKAVNEYWFRSSVEIPRLFCGTELVESLVLAVASNWTKARAKARYKVWRQARGAGFEIAFGDIKLMPSESSPTGSDNWPGVIW